MVVVEEYNDDDNDIDDDDDDVWRNETLFLWEIEYPFDIPISIEMPTSNIIVSVNISWVRATPVTLCILYIIANDVDDDDDSINDNDNMAFCEIRNLSPILSDVYILAQY